MSLLKNHICELKVLTRNSLIFNDDRPKSVNVISSVFFKRDQYYKNFGVYVKGLGRTINFIDEFNRSVSDESDKFVYLLFIDQNIRDDRSIMQLIENSPNVVPVLFTCNVYMKGSYHIDLFGTLIRFFPMFNFENNPAKLVLCADIDLNKEDLRKIGTLMRHKPEGFTGSGEIHKLLYFGETPYVFAGAMLFNREKLDKSMIVDFIEHAEEVPGKGHYGKRTTTFGYGIDEIFVNSYIIPAVKTYSVMIEYQISYFLYHSAPYLRKQGRENINRDVMKLVLYDLYNPAMAIDDMIGFIGNTQFIQDLKRQMRRMMRSENNTGNNGDDIDDITGASVHKILQNILGAEYNPKMGVNDMLKRIDESTYNITTKNPINNAIAERFYYIIHYLVSHNKVWMERPIMEIIDKYLRNVISAYVLFKVDPNVYEKLQGVELLDPVYTDATL